MDLSTLVDLDEARGLRGAVWVDARRRPGDVALAGAVWADLDVDLAAAPVQLGVEGRHPLPALSVWGATLGRWGIGVDTPVVIYDDAGGAVAAARCWWMLRAVGHARVAVLRQGWQGIVAAGMPTGPVRRSADVVARPYPVPASWALPTVDMDTVASSGRPVIDVRDGVRYRGERDPFDPTPGHIPGAVSAPFRDNLVQGVLVDDATLARRLDDTVGTGPAAELILSCGSGVTACHTLLALEHVGRCGAALFVGSYSAWCRSDRAIERG